jgi:hypothetical protein
MPFRPTFAALSVALALAAGGSACGKKSDGGGGGDAVPDYATTPLSGKIAGADWTFAWGTVKPAHKQNAAETLGDFDFYSEVIEGECEAFIPAPKDKKSVLFSAPLLTQETTLALSEQSVTLYDNGGGENSNVVATTGKLAIDLVTATKVEGRLVAVAGEADTINGTFAATRCCLDDSGAKYVACTE